jgi:hypothetical protein
MFCVLSLSIVNKLIWALFLTLWIAAPSSASVNANTEGIMKTVVYLYGGDNEGKHADPERKLGTGFLITVPLLSNNAAQYLLLVTARHIVDPAWAHCPDSPPQWLYLRMNKKNYDPQKDASGVDFYPVKLVLNETWMHHTNENVDVAVVFLMPDVAQGFDIGTLRISDFSTEEEAKRRVPSDPVMSAGLLLPFPGVKRNYPVLKFGYLSSEPDELVPCPCVKDGGPTLLKLWFLSINLLPGNSGSPIFYVPEGANNATFGGDRVALLGLQSTSFLGFDVSGMTPAQYIFETIAAAKPPDADLFRGLPQNRPTPPKQP